MSLDAFPLRSNIVEGVNFKVIGVGGSSAVTQVTGKGVALTRTGTGAYLLTWSDSPGNLVGFSAGLQATTLAGPSGHTVIFGAWAAGGTTLAFQVFNAAEALHDLAALEWVCLDLTFSSSTLNTL